jgi:ligand-binding sensor domain-containing protein
VPPGGNVTVVARAPDGTVYVSCSESRVARSTDNGATWTACGGIVHGVRSLVVDPAGVLYAGANDGASTSRDGCASWHTMGFDRDVSGLAVAGSDVLAAASDGVYRWDGTSWSPLTSPMNGHDVRDVASDPVGGILVAGDNGIARSTDGGQTWTAGNTGLNTVDVKFVWLASTHALAQTGSSLFASSDGGLTWTLTEPGSYTTAIDPTGSYALESAWGTGLNVSVNGGVTFDVTDRRSASMHVGPVMSVAFGNGQEIFAGTTRGMFYAPDHNLAWREIDSGIAAWGVRSIAETDAGVLLLGTFAGVLRSTDGGATWSDESSGLTVDSMVGGIAVVPGMPQTVVACDAHSVARSSDGGVTYTEVWTAGGPDNYHVNNVKVIAGKIVAATWAGVAISDASWSTFTHHDVAGANVRVVDVIALDTAGQQLLTATYAGVYYSSNGGATFARVDTGSPAPAVYTLAQLDNGTLLAGTEAGVLAATSPSGPWQASGLGTVSVRALLATGARVYAATDSGLFASSDGATWTLVPGLEHSTTMALAHDSAGRLLAGTYESGLFAIPLP